MGCASSLHADTRPSVSHFIHEVRQVTDLGEPQFVNDPRGPPRSTRWRTTKRATDR
jgi:hypothetical protein